MEIATTAIHILHELYKVKEQLDSNYTECIRLCDRCLAAKQPLEVLMQNSQGINSKKVSLQTFLSVLNETKEFITKYKEQTAWRLITKIAFRNSFTEDLSNLNIRLNQCLLDLHLGIAIDNESQRREDLEDSRKGFDASVRMTLEEISVQGDRAEESLAELKQAIEHNQNIIVQLLQQRNYAPLTSSELLALKQDNETLSTLTEAKLNEVLNAIRGLEIGQQDLVAGQNHVIHLIESLSLNAAQKQTRAEMVAKLELSYSDVNRGKHLCR